ncbi:MAG: hypothetical protein WEE51_09965, partial [Pirellulaceae bacterium]
GGERNSRGPHGLRDRGYVRRVVATLAQSVGEVLTRVALGVNATRVAPTVYATVATWNVRGHRLAWRYGL